SQSQATEVKQVDHEAGSIATVTAGSPMGKHTTSTKTEETPDGTTHTQTTAFESALGNALKPGVWPGATTKEQAQGTSDTSAAKAGDKYDSRVVINTQPESPEVSRAARNLADKHPGTVLAKLGDDDSLQGIIGDPAQVRGTTKVQVVGHGDGQTVGGKTPEQLAHMVNALPSDSSIKKVAVVACEGKTCAAGVQSELEKTHPGVEVTGPVGAIKVTKGGKKVATTSDDLRALPKSNAQQGGATSPQSELAVALEALNHIKIATDEPFSNDERNKIDHYLSLKYPSLSAKEKGRVIELLQQKDQAASHNVDATIEECVTGMLAYRWIKKSGKGDFEFIGLKRPDDPGISVDFLAEFKLKQAALEELMKNEIFKPYEDNLKSVAEYLGGKFTFGIDPFGTMNEKTTKSEFAAAMKKHATNVKNTGEIGGQVVGVGHTNINSEASEVGELASDMYDKVSGEFNLIILHGLDGREKPSVASFFKGWKNSNFLNSVILNPRRIDEHFNDDGLGWIY
ncbi:C80 family cysteine peptidase, partial [Burkholderia ubonensis]|uniref:C80 family cysteine peptidase n=1 Tax=Burkholderia ubonensis TaxID=101571 RepID=UPI000AE2FD38